MPVSARSLTIQRLLWVSTVLSIGTLTLAMISQETMSLFLTPAAVGASFLSSITHLFLASRLDGRRATEAGNNTAVDWPSLPCNLCKACILLTFALATVWVGSTTTVIVNIVQKHWRARVSTNYFPAPPIVVSTLEAVFPAALSGTVGVFALKERRIAHRHAREAGFQSGTRWGMAGVTRFILVLLSRLLSLTGNRLTEDRQIR